MATWATGQVREIRKVLDGFLAALGQQGEGKRDERKPKKSIKTTSRRVLLLISWSSSKRSKIKRDHRLAEVLLRTSLKKISQFRCLKATKLWIFRKFQKHGLIKLMKMMRKSRRIFKFQFESAVPLHNVQRHQTSTKDHEAQIKMGNWRQENMKKRIQTLLIRFQDSSLELRWRQRRARTTLRSLNPCFSEL